MCVCVLVHAFCKRWQMNYINFDFHGKQIEFAHRISIRFDGNYVHYTKLHTGIKLMHTHLFDTPCHDDGMAKML